MRRRGSNDVGFAWLHSSRRNLNAPPIPSPVLLSSPRSSNYRSQTCGIHTSPAPTWTSPTSCTYLRFCSSSCVELRQAAAPYPAIGASLLLTDRSQSHGELRRCRLHRPWWCREIVPFRRFVSVHLFRMFHPNNCADAYHLHRRTLYYRSRIT